MSTRSDRSVTCKIHEQSSIHDSHQPVQLLSNKYVVSTGFILPVVKVRISNVLVILKEALVDRAFIVSQCTAWLCCRYFSKIARHSSIVISMIAESDYDRI